MPGMNNQPDPDFWANILNDRADELGMKRAVKYVKSRDGIGGMNWVYETDDGDLVDLGWSAEMAEVALRDLAGG